MHDGIVLGANVNSGSILEGRNHLRQSIVDALRTPVGSRVMRPSYGSRLFFLLDRPGSDDTRAEVIAAVVETLINCVPQVTPEQVIPEEIGKGYIRLSLTVKDTKTEAEVNFKGLEVAA